MYSPGRLFSFDAHEWLLWLRRGSSRTERLRGFDRLLGFGPAEKLVMIENPKHMDVVCCHVVWRLHNHGC